MAGRPKRGARLARQNATPTGRFQPSSYSGGAVAHKNVIATPTYGNGKRPPISALTTTNTGLRNVPNANQTANLELLADFIAKIPFDVTINSGFRSREVNSAVKGSSSSQHMTGLGVDILPVDSKLGTLVPGGANRALAAWFYEHQDEFPELDQVIWYMTTRHTHVGIAPVGGVPDPIGIPGSPGKGRKQFKIKLAHGYQTFNPDPAEVVRWAKTYPVKAGLAALGIYIAASVAVSAVTLAVLWRYRWG